MRKLLRRILSLPRLSSRHPAMNLSLCARENTRALMKNPSDSTIDRLKTAAFFIGSDHSQDNCLLVVLDTTGTAYVHF